MTLTPESITAPSLRCVREGRRWRLEFGRRVTYVGYSVGMLHLSVLIASPATEIPAVELTSRVRRLTHRGGPDLTGPVPARVDDVALRAYQQRITQLYAEINDRPDADPQRVRQLREVATWLAGELTRSPGPRRYAPDDTARARSAVSKAIRRAIDRITNSDPQLGQHLVNTVHTGAHCSYHPGRMLG